MIAIHYVYLYGENNMFRQCTLIIYVLTYKNTARTILTLKEIVKIPHF